MNSDGAPATETGGLEQSSNGKKNNSDLKDTTATKRQSANLVGHGFKLQKRMRFQPESVKFNKKDAPRHEYYKSLQPKSEVEISRAICVADRVESSATEMKAMLRAVSQHTSNRAVLQKIPRHMRRRAASHNKKRLPRRLHQLAGEMSAHAKGESGETPNKAPNRKKRRRKRDLQNEYAKRAGKCGWLETHVWHAKRFHMSQSSDPKYAKWGNHIPLFPNDKSFRASYRAVAKHCLIQDMSYMRCLCLSGCRKEVIQLFQNICGVTFDDTVIDGRKEAEVILSKAISNGQGRKEMKECIGPASVLWRSGHGDEQAEVLVWMHPTILTSSLDVLTSCCENMSWKINIRNVSDDLLRFRLTGPKSSVTLMSVFRPMEKPCDASNEKNALGDWMVEYKNVIAQLHKEFINFATDCHHRIFARQNSTVTWTDDVLEHSDGSIFPVITNDPRLTLPLDKTTPTLAKARMDLEDGKENEEVLVEGDLVEEQTETPCVSPLWKEEFWKELQESRIPDHIVSTRKHDQKYKADEKNNKIWRTSLSTAVPVIAIYKVPNEDRELVASEDGSQRQKGPHCGPDQTFAAGWDLILPKNWGTAFWVPLIYHRARAGGLRENRNTNLEHLRPHFPADFPDTFAGREYINAEANSLATKHYRKPPAKRPNYSVLGVPHPFQPDWNGLFEEPHRCEHGDQEKLEKSAEEAEEEPLCKNQKIENATSSLTNISVCDETLGKGSHDDTALEAQGDINPSKDELTITEMNMVSVLRDHHQLVLLQKWIPKVIDPLPDAAMQNNSAFRDFMIPSNNLVCVAIKVLSKGIPLPCSMICMPTTEDLGDLCEELTDPYKYGLQSVTGPVEEKHWDQYRNQRKETRKQAKRNKKCKGEVITSEKVPNSDSGSKGASTSLLPKQPRCFPTRPTRDVMGYVVNGDFVFSYACGAGIGFVAVEKLCLLAERQAQNEKLRTVLKNETHRSTLLNGSTSAPLLSLMRNTGSSQYRFVNLEIIKPS